MPVIILSRVDFPLPDLPIMATNSPEWIERSMPLSTENSPASFLKFLTRRCRWIEPSWVGFGARIDSGSAGEYLPLGAMVAVI